MSSRRTLSAIALAMLCVALPPSPAHATTFVSGPISNDTTWERSGSPYVLIADVMVEPGVTLTVEPGVRVEGGHNTSLLIEGSLIADGRPESPIVFTRRIGHRDWEGVAFASVAGRSSMTHSQLSHAEVALELLLSSPTLSNLEVFNNRVGIEAISPPQGVTISASVLWGNAVAIAGRAGGTVTVTGNDFWSNEVSINAGPQRVYHCDAGNGGWQIHSNDLPRGPRNSEYWSFDMRTPIGSGDFNYEIDASGNWWGTTNERSIDARFRQQYTLGANRHHIKHEPFSSEPHTAWAPPGEVPDPEPEPTAHGDPAFVLSIENVRHGQCRDDVSSIRGFAAPALAPAPASVQVAVRRQEGGNCGWWRATKRGFSREGCAYGVWNTVDVDDDYRWTLSLRQSMPKGRYTAYVRTVQKRPQVYGCRGAGEACVRFSLS